MSKWKILYNQVNPSKTLRERVADRLVLIDLLWVTSLLTLIG